MRRNALRYPLSIRFWFFVHEQAERFYHWVWRAKIAPWRDRTDTPAISPRYRYVMDIPATEEERARGIVGKEVYATSSYALQ